MDREGATVTVGGSEREDGREGVGAVGCGLKGG